MPGMEPARGSATAVRQRGRQWRRETSTDMGMMTPAAWTAGYVVLMFFMWWAMMVAMMLPSAAPMILLFATVNRRQRDQPTRSCRPACSPGVTWSPGPGSALSRSGCNGPSAAHLALAMAVSTSSILGGLLLLAAGLYQLTPIKQACLRHCRHPISFLASHWRRGTLVPSGWGLSTARTGRI